MFFFSAGTYFCGWVPSAKSAKIIGRWVLHDLTRSPCPVSLRMQTYFRLSLVSAKNNVCEPEPGNDFCDVANHSLAQVAPELLHEEENSSFILSWNLIGRGETKVITSQKSFPGSGSQALFLAETSDSRKYVCVRRLCPVWEHSNYTVDPFTWIWHVNLGVTNKAAPKATKT